MSTVAKIYPKPGEFDRLLLDAERGARGAWEQDFVSSLVVRFEEHKSQTYLSSRQVEVLERIAGR